MKKMKDNITFNTFVPSPYFCCSGLHQSLKSCNF